MRRALAQLLPVDHRSIEKRNYKQRDNNERPNYRNVRFSVSSSAFFSVIAVSLVWFTSFYGNDGAKFSQYDSARHKLLPGGASLTVFGTSLCWLKTDSFGGNHHVKTIVRYFSYSYVRLWDRRRTGILTDTASSAYADAAKQRHDQWSDCGLASESAGGLGIRSRRDVHRYHRRRTNVDSRRSAGRRRTAIPRCAGFQC
jgi:hypothetical protein